MDAPCFGNPGIRALSPGLLRLYHSVIPEADVPSLVMAGHDPAIWRGRAPRRPHTTGPYSGHPTQRDEIAMPPIVHPGRLLKRELLARGLGANRLALDLGVPSGRITDILNGRRSITADTAVRLGRYFGNGPQFWLNLQSQHDIAVVEGERGKEIARPVKSADAA